MTAGMENMANENNTERVQELRAKLEQELAVLLAHPLVPEEFKKVFKERE